MKKKNTIKKDELFVQSKFCTECGEELEDFTFDKDAADQETVKNRYHKCKETGKFKGDICSRMFINNLEEEHLPDDDLNAPENEVY